MDVILKGKGILMSHLFGLCVTFIWSTVKFTGFFSSTHHQVPRIFPLSVGALLLSRTFGSNSLKIFLNYLSSGKWNWGFGLPSSSFKETKFSDFWFQS